MTNTSVLWVADFKINEPLHSFSSSISGAYSRMIFNFQNHPEASKWKEESLKWHEYYTNVNKMNFATEQEGLNEVDRIGKIASDVLNKEKELINSNS